MSWVKAECPHCGDDLEHIEDGKYYCEQDNDIYILVLAEDESM